MADRYAPAGQVWLCMMCGKTAKDYCGGERGWDESCAMNCILVDEATKQPTDEQAQQFHEARNRRMDAFPADFAKLLQRINSTDTSDIDPELLKLAEEAVARSDGVKTLPGDQA